MEGGANPVQKFRASLNDFKRPYIERLEEYEPEAGDEEPMGEGDIQNVALIRDALNRMDLLYLILEAAIRNNGTNQRPDLEAKAVCSVFEKNGSFADIRRDPNLKEEFLKYLKLDLKVFPFTLNTRLIDSFMRNGVEPHQREGPATPDAVLG
jgi:hypothetical protein